MYMKDWVDALDSFLKFTGCDILMNAGKISKELADKTAEAEYEIYNQHRIKRQDQETLDEIIELENLE